MNQKKNPFSQGHGAKHAHGQQHGNPQMQRPGVMQPKLASAQLIKSSPAAPPAYRPQTIPKVLQCKTAPVQPSQAGRPAQRRAEPPVYRPQPVPKVLQTKVAGGQQPQSTQTPRRPIAPPVYRPEQKRLVQPKMASASQAPKPPQSPPAYRPQPAPQVLQRKALAGNDGQRSGHRAAFNPAIPATGKGHAALAVPGVRPSGGTVVQRVIGTGGSQLHGRSVIDKTNDQVGEITLVVSELLDNGSEVDPTYRIRFPNGDVADAGAQAREFDLLAIPIPPSEAVKELYDYMSAIELSIDLKGLNADVWDDAKFNKLLDFGSTLYNSLQKFIEDLDCGDKPSLSTKDLQRLERKRREVARFNAELDRANRVLSLVNKDIDHGLSGVQQLGQQVGGHVAAAKFTFPAELANKLRPKIGKYHNLWDSMGTDGLKGMKVEHVKGLENLRQEMAKMVAASSASLDVKAAFYAQLKALASQSCSSRDVQNFGGWFDSHVQK